MNAEQTIEATQLAAFLQVPVESFAYWEKREWLIPDRQTVENLKKYRFYRFSTLDSFLQRALAPGGDPQKLPSFAQLLAFWEEHRTNVFLTPDELENRLEISRDTRAAVTKSGDLLAFYLTLHTPRFLLTSVVAFGRKLRAEGAVAGKLAQKMLGVKEKKFSSLAPADKSGPFIRQEVPLSHGEIYITTSSLMQFLALQLNCTAEKWWDLRVEHNFDPLLTLEEIRTKYRVHERTIKKLIADGTLPCLTLPGATGKKILRRIPLHAVDRWWATEYAAWPPERLAKVFGVAPDAAAEWAAEGKLCYDGRHRIETKQERCPALQCLIRYIEQYAIGDVDGKEWLCYTLEKLETPVLASDLKRDRSLWAAIEEALNSGQVRGVRLPNKDVAILRPEEVVAYRLRLKREERDFFQRPF